MEAGTTLGDRAAVEFDTSGSKIGPVIRRREDDLRSWRDGIPPKVLWTLSAPRRLAPGSTSWPARPAAHLRPSLPPRGRRTGSDPVSAGPRLHPDDGALSRMQAECSVMPLRCCSWSSENLARVNIGS